MSAVKDKTKRRSVNVAPPNNDIAEHVSKRKSKHMSRKAVKVAAPKELVNAIKESKVDVIQSILESTPTLLKSFSDPESNQTLFHTAIRTGSLPVVECLISAGVPLLDVDLKFRNALHFLARVRNPSQALIDRVVGLEGMKISAGDVSGASPLHLAIRYNNTLLTTSLIAAKGILIDAQDVTGLTPLHYACHEGLESIVSKLLEAGASSTATDHKGNTPLHYACDTGSVVIGKLLLAKGVDVMAVNSKGDTPLHRAVEKKQELMCSWLVNNGADVMVRYEKRLYEARHKAMTRKYLRQAAREARSQVPEHVDDVSDAEQHGEDSDGEDLPDDPEGMLSLHDHLDTYGFLIGSEKSNQLHAAEHSGSISGKPNDASSSAGGKKKKKGAASDEFDDDLAVGGASAAALQEREKKQQKLIKKWVKITKMWNEKGAAAVHKNWSTDKLRSLIYNGIPNHVRAGVWRCISGTYDTCLAHNGEYDRLSTQPISRKYSHQLDVDINRTNRSHFLFKERYGQGQISLFCILRAYCNYDPVVGYCQGMSDLTALMMQYVAEEEAFWLLVRFMKDPIFNMAGRFEDGFKDLKRAWYVHEKLVATHLPKLHALLSSAHIEAAHYTIKWYLKCFLDALSFDIVLRIWDVLLLEGSDILYSFVITLLSYHESAILAMDPGELLMHLPGLKGPPPHISVDSWLKDVKHHPIKTKLLRAYEAEFDAQWPAMQAAAKAEADRRQEEWAKRREKAEKAAEKARIAAALAAEDIEEDVTSPHNGETHSSAPNDDSDKAIKKDKRTSKRHSKRKSRQAEALSVEA